MEAIAGNESSFSVAPLNNTTGAAGNHIADANVILLCLLGVLSCFVIAANLFVIVLVYRTSYLKTITNYCLVCLAVSDLLSGLIAVPMIIVCNTVQTRATCIAMDLSSRFISISTIMHLLLVTIERYIMIVFPMKYPRVVTKRRIRRVLLALWCFSFTVTLVQLSWIGLGEEAQENAEIREIEVIYSFCGIFGIVGIPLLAMAFVYSHIFLVLRKQVKRIALHLTHLNAKASKRRLVQLKAVRVFGTMILAFVLGWLPYFLSAVLSDLKITYRVPIEVDTLFFFLRFLTPLVNPLLYTIFKEDFKKAFRSVVCKGKLKCQLREDMLITASIELC